MLVDKNFIGIVHTQIMWPSAEVSKERADATETVDLHASKPFPNPTARPLLSILASLMLRGDRVWVHEI